ncbi:unnamed protein product [Closterium sp. Naga37s-1]|nr:unnamed protein product [Closterium sp. Naga37s-1]
MDRNTARRTPHGDGPPHRPKASPTTFTIPSPLCLCICACSAVQLASAVAGEAGAMEHGMSLFRAWTAAYGLADDPRSALPPSPLALPANVPPAPHLEDCAQASFYRFIAEDRSGGGGGGEGEGGLPKWAVQPSCCHCSPQTPWFPHPRLYSQRHSPPATALLDPSRAALHRATPHLSAHAFPSHPPFSALHCLLHPPFFLPSTALPSDPLSAPSLLCAFRPTLLVPFLLCSERTTPPIALMPHPDHTAPPSSPSACPTLLPHPAAPPCCPTLLPLPAVPPCRPSLRVPPCAPLPARPCPLVAAWYVPSPHGMCPHPMACALTPWHVPSPHGMCPHPMAWQVRGSDADSLAHTREAQRDIWTNQMPPRASPPALRCLSTCPQLLLCCVDVCLSATPTARNGSAARPSHAAQQNPRAASRNLPASQQPGVQRCVFGGGAALTAQAARAGGRHACVQFQAMGGMGSNGSVGDWGCFFFPIASPHCSADISAAMATSRMPPCHRDTSQFEQLATSADRVVCLDASDVDQSSSAALSSVEARVTKIWGGRHVEQQAQREYLGEVPPTDEFTQQVHWWRAQAVRFMLRWPSAHLCHVINQQRHTAYGIHVANHISSLPAIYASILQSVAATSAGPAAAQNLSLSAEASDLATLDLIPGSNPDSQPRASSMGAGLEARVWGARGFDRCSELCGGVGMGEYGRVGGEPLFVVRPMVGVVMGGSGGMGAGGGGGGEEGRGGRSVVTSSGMGVGVHVMAASVLRLSDVDVRHMWVSWHAQQQAPPAPAANTAALSPSPAAESAAAAIGPAALAAGAGSTVGGGESGGSEGAGGGSMVGAVEAGGDGWGEGERMARLVVVVQCDAFVGMHGDEWAELLDEMRCTGGRRQSRFVFINVP